MADETLLQTFFTRLGFQADTKGLDDYKSKIVDLSSSLLKLSGVGALSLGGLFEFTRRAVEPLGEVAKMADTYGIATNTIAAFNRMGKDFGITSDAMMSGLKSLNVQMGAVSGPAAARLRKLVQGYGLDIHDASGKTKDMQTFLGDVADRMTTLSTQEQVNFVQKLGLDPTMVRMLRNGREEFERLYQEASKGLPFKEEDYVKAERFSIEFEKAKTALGVISSSIALTLMPAFQRAMTSFLYWWRANGERVMERIKYWVGMFAQWFGNALSFIGRLAGQTDLLNVAMKVLGVAVGIIVGQKLVSWIQTAAGAFKALATANWAALLPQIAMAAAILALIAVILLAIDDFETWKKGGVSVIGALIDWFNRGAKGMEQLRKVGLAVWQGLSGIWKFAASAWGDAFQQMKKAIQAWWPIVKIALIVVGGFLAMTLVTVIALAGAFVYLLGKVLSISATVAAWIAKLITSPKEALAELSNWLQSLIDKAGDWVHQISGKVGAALAAWASSMLDKIDAWLRDLVGRGEAAITGWFSSMLDRAEKWINDLLNGIGEWIGAKGGQVVAAFVGIFTLAATAIKTLFTDGVNAMLDAVGEILQAWWDKWVGKFTGFADKIKGVLTGAATAATPAVGAIGGEAPPILGGAGATPMLGPNVGGKWLDTSQMNSNNVTQNNTFNVKSMDEATNGAKKLASDAKQQAVNPYQVAGALVH